MPLTDSHASYMSAVVRHESAMSETHVPGYAQRQMLNCMSSRPQLRMCQQPNCLSPLPRPSPHPYNSVRWNPRLQKWWLLPALRGLPAPPRLYLHPHPPLHPPQPQPQPHPLLLQPPQPPQFPPPQPQLFPPPQPQQQNRMMIRTIHRQPLSFPLLKHIVSHLSLDPGPRLGGVRTLDLRYSMLPASAGSLTP